MSDFIDINTVFGPLPAAASDLAVDELASLMERHGVRACCTLSTVGILLDHHAGNGATRAACAEDTALIPAATLNPKAYFGGAGPHTRFAADGFRLVRFFPAIQGWEIDMEPFGALLRAMDEETLPVMVDIGGPGDASRLVRAFSGHPGSLILAGIDEHTVAEALCLMRTNPDIYVETSRLLAMGAIKVLIDSVGSGRLLFGSGAPARPMASGLNLLRHSGIGDEDRQNILSGNARRILGL